MNFDRMLELREENNLLQKDIAEIIGVSQQTYSLWENGIKIIPLKHLNKMCDYYKVSMDYILNLSNDKNYYIIQKLDKIKVGNNIRMIRKKYNLTLRELARTLNTTYSTISAYENGKTLILTAFAYQIANDYDVSMDWLVGKSDVMTRKELTKL